jgi:hypothetical protein
MISNAPHHLFQIPGSFSDSYIASLSLPRHNKARDGSVEGSIPIDCDSPRHGSETLNELCDIGNKVMLGKVPAKAVRIDTQLAAQCGAAHDRWASHSPHSLVLTSHPDLIPSPISSPLPPVTL